MFTVVAVRLSPAFFLLSFISFFYFLLDFKNIYFRYRFSSAVFFLSYKSFSNPSFIFSCDLWYFLSRSLIFVTCVTQGQHSFGQCTLNSFSSMCVWTRKLDFKCKNFYFLTLKKKGCLIRLLVTKINFRPEDKCKRRGKEWLIIQIYEHMKQTRYLFLAFKISTKRILLSLAFQTISLIYLLYNPRKWFTDGKSFFNSFHIMSSALRKSRASEM